MGAFYTVIDFLNGIIWSPALVYGYLFLGLYLSLRIRFLQVRLIKPMIALLFKSGKPALCTALTGRIGAGNIAGTAAAILWGGPGALFWMWMSAFLGASFAYIEAALIQLYKVEAEGGYSGGPAYYILCGLKSPGYAMFFSASALIACGFLLPGVQSNAIASAFNNAVGAPVWLTGLAVAALLGLTVFGGVKRFASSARLIVSGMAVLYMLTAMMVIIVNAGELGRILRLVFSSAFNLHAIFGGLTGQAIAWGVKRGVYSHEAGLGTAPHAAAAGISHPAQQGLIQAFAVYIDSLFICSATGLMMLMTNSFNVIGLNGAGYLYRGADPAMTELAQTGAMGPEFAQAGAGTLFPGFGSVFVAVCLAFFAFTSVAACYRYAQSNIAYMFRGNDGGGRKALTMVLRIVMVAAVFCAALIPAGRVWAIGDLGVGVMAWINIMALWLLQDKGLLTLKDYEKQATAGQAPVFDPADHGLDLPVWTRIHAAYKAKT